ncbi:hypothetical protein I316_02959 [Kwoniella heveanensis BCC8398]|uniref:PAC domain-containing protein n=1 Tax=Kwoniella heveanensis BCC8398 TaxID=1296120 RepID=A0A1B9GWM2_9TREE|nr:hypothetical protein I316_02959 [Kwoniella heveanensis BCC8398]
MSSQVDQDGDEVWDLLDALEHFNARASQEELSDGELASLEEALAIEPVSPPAISVASSGILDHVEVPHFPALSQTVLNGDGAGQVRTSEPISVGIHQNQEENLLGMASKDRFKDLLQNQMGFTRFEQWIDDEGLPGSKRLLMYYKDLRASSALFAEVQALGNGLQEVYFGKEASQEEQIASLSHRPSTYIPSLSSASLGLHTAQEEATDRLYATEFKRFITGNLTEQAKARLQFIPDHKKRGDLGEVFCIADPRLPDQPLVFISDAFCRLSEYPRDLLIGRNCRFLQGPETDRAAVGALRVAIEAGQEHCCLLLNYTRTGRPFWNLLNMIPLKGTNGAVEYLLGAQIDVTSAMSASKAFKDLKDLAQPITTDKDGALGSFGLSEEVINRNVQTEKQLSRQSIVRQIRQQSHAQSETTSPSQAVSYPGPNTVSQRKQSFAPVASLSSPVFSSSSNNSPKLSSDKKSTWFLKLKSGVDSPIAMTSNTVPSSIDDPSAVRIPAGMRDRMSDFTAAHSKLIVFDAKCGRIQYVTPPLLAYLRYPIRSHKDRLASGLLRLDISEILTGETPTQTASIVKSVRDVVSAQSTHSVFAGLLLSQSGRGAPDYIADALTDNGKKFVRSLLHLTPVKDRRNASQMYVVVVG